MTRLACVLGLVVMAAACGADSTPEAIDIRLSSPAEARLGENTFEVTVMEGTKPVVDADVSLELFMAAMPSMNMPAMRNAASLQHVGGGVYRGTGQVMTAGRWDVTVTVMRGGLRLGSRQLSMVAR